MHSQTSKARPRLEPLEDRTLLSTCHVTRLTDQGIGMGFRGDLRYCITKVNANPGADIIDFHVTGMINLTGVLPSLTAVDIQGPGANALMVRRDTGGFYRIFTVPPGQTVQISGLTMVNGRIGSSNAQGGGIHNTGNLTLVECNLSGNEAFSSATASGGGIYNAGAMTIIDSTIESNSVNGFNGNGGGIYNQGTLSIYSSTISGNVAAPSFDSFGSGGGIYNNGSMVVLNSTVISNTSPWGGIAGIRAGGSLNVISHSTISHNDGGGGGIHAVSNVYMRNTIVASNFAGDNPNDVSGTLTSSGFNLIGNSSTGSGFAATDLLDVDPKFAGFGAWGGPTSTMGLFPDSPAINAGDNTDAPEWDQRGPGFPRIVNGTIDIGAFEVQSSPIPSSPRPTQEILAMILATADWDVLD